MIMYRDFLPEATREGWFAEAWPPLDDLVETMNRWVRDEAIDVISVETVVVPTLAGGSASTRLVAETWDIGAVQQQPAFQFLRVWYRAG